MLQLCSPLLVAIKSRTTLLISNPLYFNWMPELEKEKEKNEQTEKPKNQTELEKEK